MDDAARQELESKLAHLEYLFDQLNEVVIQQGKKISRLETELQSAAASLQGIELDRVRNNQQKPPHYQ
ncbi:MAG: SlyX family protein [Verrucomicrobiota bacterium]|nr:SlyX family protein [Verrucomicrobiota bacterium]